MSNCVENAFRRTPGKMLTLSSIVPVSHLLPAVLIPPLQNLFSCLVLYKATTDNNVVII